LHYREMRIEIHVGTRIFYFLLEERTGNYAGFQVSGRSLSAKIDSPYEKEVTFSLQAKEAASSVADTIADIVTLIWSIDDWILPASFTFTSINIEGLVQIAAEAEGIVRSNDAGEIVIRNKYSVRPIDINGNLSVITYTPEDNLIQLDIRETIGTKENIIKVEGYSEEIELPQLEVEDSPNGNHIKGEDIFIRAYWGTNTPPDISEIYATAGRVNFVSRNNTEEIEEIVTFADGKAQVSKPIASVISTSWIGAGAGAIECQQFSNELYITEMKARVATIKYRAAYNRYKISGHNVTMLIYVMVINSRFSVAVKVLMGIADKEAQAISKPLLTNSNSAIKAGIAFLDDKKYDTIEIDFVAPYSDLARDGIIIRLEDPQMELYGNCHVRDVTIDFDGPKVTNKITAVKFKT